jgi:hypothetical protein
MATLKELEGRVKALEAWQVDKEHQRVFTESEVKAMMEDVAHCITWPEAKRVLKSKHGLLLDPA